MRSIKIIVFVAILAVATIATTAFNAKPSAKVKSDNNGFAVIELFTSEGCSSCPPADELVAKIQSEMKDKAVYILAYHVDYWNRLGWKDQFSSAEFSKRQSDYANYLHLQSVYTPQIVVNGKTEFVGSEESTLRKAINTSLKKTSSVRVTLNLSNIDQRSGNVKYTVSGEDKHTDLLIAVLQKNGQSKVERGENAGHILSHVQIVNKLQKVTLTGDTGTAKIALPYSFDAQSWEVIGFLQNTENGTIAGAARASFTAGL